MSIKVYARLEAAEDFREFGHAIYEYLQNVANEYNILIEMMQIYINIHQNSKNTVRSHQYI